MKIGITGTGGRVGGALADHFARKGCAVTRLDRKSCDLTNDHFLSSLDPAWDVLIHPAAMSSPDDCEDEPELARAVNTVAPQRMAKWCAAHGVRMVHFSTDYVFSGESEGKRGVDDAACPVNHYGATKRESELCVFAEDPSALVLRVSWIYGAEKPGFVDAVVSRLLREEPITAVADKFSLPTRMADLTNWLDRLLATNASGIVHACHSGDAVSWYGVAQAVADEMHGAGRLRKVPEMTASRLVDIGAFRARRPVHTAMDHASLEKWIGPVSAWRDALQQHVAELRP